MFLQFHRCEFKSVSFFNILWEKKSQSWSSGRIIGHSSYDIRSTSLTCVTDWIWWRQRYRRTEIKCCCYIGGAAVVKSSLSIRTKHFHWFGAHSLTYWSKGSVSKGWWSTRAASQPRVQWKYFFLSFSSDFSCRPLALD